MTIKQLRYIIAITDNQFNISLAAEKLFTSQPAISKQIKQIEDSLSCKIFTRNGKSLIGLTHQGELIIEQARTILTEFDNLLRLSTDGKQHDELMRVATTATQSNYVLPDIIKQFKAQFPSVRLCFEDGNIDQLIHIGKNREADCIIISGINEKLQRHWFPNMIMLPCYEWHQMLIAHPNHPIAKKSQPITIDDLIGLPIITYPVSKHIGSMVEKSLKSEHIKNAFTITANDPYVIKRYVRDQLGVGIIAPMAYDEDQDRDLFSLSLKDIMPKCTTIIAIERHNILKPHVYQFIRLFAPHLTHQDIETAIQNDADLRPDEIKLPDQIGTWVI